MLTTRPAVVGGLAVLDAVAVCPGAGDTGGATVVVALAGAVEAVAAVAVVTGVVELAWGLESLEHATRPSAATPATTNETPCVLGLMTASR